MNPESVSFWADIAAIFLIAQAILIILLIGAVLGVGWWYLRKGRRALATPLLMGQVYALRVQNVTMKATDAIANVPISINATFAQVTTTVHTLYQSLRKSRNP